MSRRPDLGTFALCRHFPLVCTARAAVVVDTVEQGNRRRPDAAMAKTVDIARHCEVHSD